MNIQVETIFIHVGGALRQRQQIRLGTFVTESCCVDLSEGTYRTGLGETIFSLRRQSVRNAEKLFRFDAENSFSRTRDRAYLAAAHDRRFG